MKNNTSLLYRTLLMFAAILAASVPVKIYGQSGASIDEAISGFEEEAAAEDEKDESGDSYDSLIDDFDDDLKSDYSSVSREPQKPSVFSVDGYLKTGASYAFSHDAPEPGQADWRGLNRLQTEARLELNARFSKAYRAIVSGNAFYDFAYLIKGRDEFTDEVLESREKEYELRDTYFLATPVKSLDIKAGRQIVVWGKSDNLRVTDVLNPMDMREPGITDIENLRLPVTMVKASCYIAGWGITGIAIPEIRFNKTPEYGSEYYSAPIRYPDEDIPEHGFKKPGNMEYAASLNGVFSKWDISFYWARFFRDNPHLKITDKGLRMKHARLTMAGTAGNMAIGSWLLKAEAAYFDGFKYFNAPDKTFSKIDLLGGVEYMGFENTMISIEGYGSHTNDYDKALGNFPDYLAEDEAQAALRITRSFLNETLDVIILIMTLGDEGLAMRYSAEYDIIDALAVSGGVLIYKSDEDNSLYSEIGENDRGFLEVKYSF